MSEAEPKDVVLTITLNKNGVNVNGPIQNEPLVFWMLEKAKDVVKVFNIQANKPLIEKSHGIMGFVRNRLR